MLSTEQDKDLISQEPNDAEVDAALEELADILFEKWLIEKRDGGKAGIS